MKHRTLAGWLSGMVLGASVVGMRAEVKDNPYQVIVERNAFALKPPPPPASTTPNEPPPSSVDVVLTGISTLGGGKKVLIQITDKGPGMKPSFPPPLVEGDIEGRVEIVSIDPDKGEVMIKLDGNDKKLTFEKPKAAVAAAPPGAPPNPFAPQPGAIPMPLPGGIPAPVAPAAAPATSGRYGVVTGGASAPSVPAPVTPNAAGAVNVGGINPMATSFGSGLPTRPLRTDGSSLVVGGVGSSVTASPTTPQTPVRSMTLDEARAHVREQHSLVDEARKAGYKVNMPPLPPVPGWPPQNTSPGTPAGQ